MNRITVDEVRAAIDRTKLVLVQKKTLKPHSLRPCGCPIGILAYDRTNGSIGSASLVEAAYEIDLDATYASAFVGGFDGVFDREYACKTPQLTEIQRQGLIDGIEVAEALLPPLGVPA